MGMGVEEIFRSRLRKLFYENIYIELIFIFIPKLLRPVK